MRLTGGYVITKLPLFLSGDAHTGSLERPISGADLDAINRVQATPWRINRWLLDVMAEAWSKGLTLPGLATGATIAVPRRYEDNLWAALSDEDRREHIRRKREAHENNASAVGRRQAILDRLCVAQELRDRESIWFPHARDFRGRMYPIPTAGPHPQGDDVARALLMFSSGVPLGEDGLFWLCVRAANAFGHDKMPLESRVEWTLQNCSQIKRAARKPFACDWWTSAEQPWSFLATCYELAACLSMSSPDSFYSHLSVPLDGTCNGLQHLSAMGLDPIGALATNLAPGPRQDIYEEVARHVRAAVEEDAAAGVMEALLWHGKVTREVCKRAVMTTPLTA